ncbi:MAG: glutamate mutase L, partial [Deltaproteobacteria bacterium]|nr:glutamate mutase L [Deltaproteobacteria bacterium]
MSHDNRYVITDCGSTTTKAVLIEKIDGVFRQKYRGESSTTVEEPFLDVTVGVKNALKQLEEISGLNLIDSEGGIISNSKPDSGCGMYLSTSSAGGGLQMVVMGMVSSISCDSALKAALGAGAIVFDTISFDDFEGTTPFEYVETLRQMRPDMVLLSGGTEGGQREGVAELAQLLKAASPRPRFGDNYKMPVIYAGNSEIAEEIKRILKDCADVIVESNVRPDMENENIDGARKRIHTLFLEHVMQHSPGFSKLSALVDFEILPTPLAVGDMLKLYAKNRKKNVLCADIGGATTDIFSVVDGHFNRTVSANLGMSYSASFVLAKSGIDNITRWAPHLDKREVYNQILNKTVLPASLPADLDELDGEHALAREALALSFEQHCEFSKGLKGTITGRNIDAGFSVGNKPLVTGANIDVIIASGGVLSHAPEEIHTVAMVVDSFLPSGITLIAKDSIFMLPHLGVLSKVNKKAAMDVFENDCIINLCTHVAPVYKNDNLPKIKKDCLEYAVTVGSKVYKGLIKSNELYLIKLPVNIEVQLEIEMKRGWRIDNRGKLKTKVMTGSMGILFDTRGRPLNHDILSTFKDIIIVDKRDAVNDSEESNGYNFNFSAAPLTVDNRIEISRKITIPQNGEVLVNEGDIVIPGQEIVTYH